MTETIEPKYRTQQSVLQEWVMCLPLRAQGTLLTGIRGCDLAPKNPASIDARYGCSTGECTAERSLSAFLRYLTLNPADEREVGIEGAWFRSEPPKFKPSQLGHYPLHWYSHIMHCYEVVGYLHPDERLATQARAVYFSLVDGLHLEPESRDKMLNRLTEDRIEAGTVVS